MDKFVVPQFIDTEDKILGPLTARQFLIMLFAAMVIFVEYKLLDFGAFVFSGLATFGACGILAFLRINGMPFHYFLLNLTQTLRKPGIRIWDKALNDSELKAIINEPPPPPPPPRIRKDPLAETRLAELSLVVNTGGVYNPDED